MSKCK